MRRQTRNQAGMTLVEMLLGVALTSVLGLGMMKVFKANSAVFGGEQKVEETYSNARNIVGTISRQVRQLGYNPTEESTGLFGLKDSTGAFTTTTMTSNTSIFFTWDANGDGVLQNNEYAGWRLTGATIEQCTGNPCVWTTKYQNVTAFQLYYAYSDGTGTVIDATGTVTDPAYPKASPASDPHHYSKLWGITVNVNVQSRAKHDLTQQYTVENNVDSVVLLRNNLK